MKKDNILGLVLLMVVVLLTALVAPAHVASWSEKITGGGQAIAGGTCFSITVSAWTTDDGEDAGQMEYSRSNLSIHAKIQCVRIHDDGDVAVVAGPADVQNDPDGIVGAGTWMVVEILEGGVGYGDRVRVRLKSETVARGVCDNPSGSFPGLIYDGNFNIRSKQPHLQEKKQGTVLKKETGDGSLYHFKF